MYPKIFWNSDFILIPQRLTPVLDLMYQHNPNPQGLFSPFPINFVGITQGKNNQDKDILNIIDQ